MTGGPGKESEGRQCVTGSNNWPGGSVGWRCAYDVLAQGFLISLTWNWNGGKDPGSDRRTSV